MMKKSLSTLCVMLVLVGSVWAKDLALVFSRKAWNEIPAKQKQWAKSVFKECTTAPKVFEVNWGHLKGTNEWNVVNFANGAWVLKQKGTGIDSNKIEKIKFFLGNNPQVYLYWTDDLEADLKAAGITNRVPVLP